MTKSASSPNLKSSNGLESPVAKPFTRLMNGIWLHDRPENDVYELLIDVYRLRLEDDYNFKGEVPHESMYGGRVADGRHGLRCMLQLASNQRRALLPAWWDASKEAACIQFGLRGDDWSDLGAAVKKSDVIDYYGDPRFPMQLRMFGEDVYGTAPGGAGGKDSMLAMMVAMEGEEAALRYLPT